MKNETNTDEISKTAKSKLRRMLNKIEKEITKQPLSMQRNLKGKFKVD